MIKDLIARATAEDWGAVHEPEQMAKADPTVLRPHLRELLERGLLWPSVLFAGMDDATELTSTSRRQPPEPARRGLWQGPPERAGGANVAARCR